MKFYKYSRYENYIDQIYSNELTAIYSYSTNDISFFKNGFYNNNKNAAYIRCDGYKQFWLNHKCFGVQNNFTKYSWRKFVKLQAFL